MTLAVVLSGRGLATNHASHLEFAFTLSPAPYFLSKAANVRSAMDSLTAELRQTAQSTTSCGSIHSIAGLIHTDICSESLVVFLPREAVGAIAAGVTVAAPWPRAVGEENPYGAVGTAS